MRQTMSALMRAAPCGCQSKGSGSGRGDRGGGCGMWHAQFCWLKVKRTLNFCLPQRRLICIRFCLLTRPAEAAAAATAAATTTTGASEEELHFGTK